MKNAFTMIELIFVIVIIGILSAVALPRFMGIANSAESTKCKAMIGNLNRSVSYGIWSKCLGDSGCDMNTSVTASKIEKEIDLLETCGTATQLADATQGTSFTINVGGADYNISATTPTKQATAQWIFKKL